MASVSDLEAQDFFLDDKDRHTLTQGDETYQIHTWKSLKHTIGMAISVEFFGYY